MIGDGIRDKTGDLKIIMVHCCKGQDNTSDNHPDSC